MVVPIPIVKKRVPLALSSFTCTYMYERDNEIIAEDVPPPPSMGPTHIEIGKKISPDKKNFWLYDYNYSGAPL